MHQYNIAHIHPLQAKRLASHDIEQSVQPGPDRKRSKEDVDDDADDVSAGAQHG